jgi:hypothetical protein
MMKSFYLLSLVLLCTTTLFGAATSGAIPSGSIAQQPEPIPSLHELVLRAITKDITTKKPITSSAYHIKKFLIPSVPLSMQHEPITIQSLQMQAQKLAENFLATPALNVAPARTTVTTVQSADDLKTIIASAFSPEQFKKLQDYGLYEIIFNRLANILAKDYFLKLSPKKEWRKPELLPEWLREHFTGVSIQDLLDYNDIDFSDEQIFVNDEIDQYLWLDNMYINDLIGLDKTPAINDYLHSLRFGSNLITTIKSNAFAKFQGVNEIVLDYNNITVIEPHAFDILRLSKALNPKVYLHNNPIANDPKERARVEEEVRIATNGRGRVIWDESRWKRK